MIESLHIEDLGVIEEADLPLSRGLTALTGETGAGKTMVLTSLGLLLGQSQWHANDVDLCWHVKATDEKDNTVADHKYCTTWLAKNDWDPNKFGSGRVSGYGAEGRAMRWRTK